MVMGEIRLMDQWQWD